MVAVSLPTTIPTPTRRSGTCAAFMRPRATYRTSGSSAYSTRGLSAAPPPASFWQWNRREQALIDTNPDRVPPLALPPLADNAILGTLNGSDYDRVAGEGARTVPPREHGGNVDIKNLTIGSRVYFPVYVEGAKLSLGDLHFSQGDGEISF